MKKTDVTLIEGTFNADEALRVVSGVLNSKINYHKLEDFSNHVRFDSALLHSKKRINELQNAQSDLATLIDFAKQNGKKIKIDSTIIIELLD